MELQISDLISAIKKDGIESAEKSAKEITDAAEARAQTMISDAAVEAQRIIDRAKNEADEYLAGAELNAKQAQRDAVIAFGDEVRRQFERILSAEVGKCLSGDALAKLIAAALQGENAADYALEIEQVSDVLKSELAGQIKDGLELRPTNKVSSGFRLASKDGSGYFDCSQEEISRMLMPFFRELSI